MSTQAPFVAVSAPDVSNGVHTSQSAAAINTKYGAGNCRTASRDFTCTFRGAHISFPKNVPVPVDAATAAFLTSIGAPVT